MIEHPPVTLTHRQHPWCTLPEHVAPIGFDTDEPSFEYHGESLHPDAVNDQCMCGHVPYFSCPDYLGVWVASDSCLAGAHASCDKSGRNDYTKEVEPDACSCECHALPFADALAEQGRAS